MLKYLLHCQGCAMQKYDVIALDELLLCAAGFPRVFDEEGDVDI